MIQAYIQGGGGLIIRSSTFKKSVSVGAKREAPKEFFKKFQCGWRRWRGQKTSILTTGQVASTGNEPTYPRQPGQKLICSIRYTQLDRAAYAYCKRQRGVRAEAAPARTLWLRGW